MYESYASVFVFVTIYVTWVIIVCFRIWMNAKANWCTYYICKTFTINHDIGLDLIISL